MPAFKKFGPGDLLDNVLVLEPRYELASGALGWHGGPAGSGSTALYGGTRRVNGGVVQQINYQPLYPGLSQFGPVPRSVPQTSSVNLVWMTNQDLSASQRNATNWGNEHFTTVQRLYGYHLSVDSDYVTASYDYYCLYFQKDSSNVLAFNSPVNNTPAWNLTSSFTIEAWVKPFLTSSTNQDFTIASMNRVFWFGITGSTGLLLMSSSYGSFTSSLGPALNRWSHVACAYDASSQTGSFTVNMGDAGSFVQTTFSTSLGTFDPNFTVGNVISGTVANDLAPSALSTLTGRGMPRRSFHGLIGETRLWYLRRSVAQLSATMGISLTASFFPLTGSVVRTRLNDGPLTTFPTDAAFAAPNAMGSGTIDVSAVERMLISSTNISFPFGYLLSFNDRAGPVWMPNDNVRFTPPKRLAGPNLLFNQNLIAAAGSTTGVTGSGYASVGSMLVVDVPTAFSGRQIVPGSVVMTDRAYSSGSYGLVRVLVDDSHGGLYVSGSVCSSSIAGKEDYKGVGWAKVGNVFYGEGLIVIKDPALLDFGRTDGASSHPNDTFQLSFRGTSRVPVKTLMCRLEPGEFNCTLNPTYWRATDADLKRSVRHTSASIRISTVGIYNSDREIVAVARFAEPIRKRPRDRLNLKLRFDF